MEKFSKSLVRPKVDNKFCPKSDNEFAIFLAFDLEAKFRFISQRYFPKFIFKNLS